jgi:signal transduction histidine kinase
MSRLLNALLDISKLESGAIKPEMTDFTVAAIFAELRNEFAGLAEAKGLQLTVESSTECARSDASLVEQVLRNLLSNAIQYTRFVPPAVFGCGPTHSLRSWTDCHR